ncbi:MAG: hypothetical protein FWF54_07330 [Candidatus Azobacteroides sp.]|nr:hypothetical protein [Candidatus Azobacteroides sp.]
MVDINYLKDLVDVLIYEKKGLIIQGFSYFKEGKIEKILNFDDLLLFQPNFLRAFTEKKIEKYGYPFSKGYNRSIIENHKLRFDESIHYSEDLLFMLSYIQYAEYIRFVSSSNYNYRRDMNIGLSHKYNSYESEYSLYVQYKTIIHNLLKSEQKKICFFFMEKSDSDFREKLQEKIEFF